MIQPDHHHHHCCPFAVVVTLDPSPSAASDVEADLFKSYSRFLRAVYVISTSNFSVSLPNGTVVFPFPLRPQLSLRSSTEEHGQHHRRAIERSELSCSSAFQQRLVRAGEQHRPIELFFLLKSLICSISSPFHRSPIDHRAIPRRWSS